jgi:diadenosine tetraphosphate (Ap4A) HIT family hydrolase
VETSGACGAGIQKSGMTLSASPFSGLVDLRQRFIAGLGDMLTRHDGLGVYILVLANAAQDPALWPPLRDQLMARQQRHAAAIKAALRSGAKLDAPEDDLMVFLKLMALDLGPDEFESLQVSPCRQIGVWEVQFNPLRALRPARMSEVRVEGLRRPFDANGFHFNKPFLAKEVLWHGELAGKSTRLLYNKFPFAPLHGLLAPEPELQRPQFLTPELHSWAWDVAQAAAAAIPGFGLAYNSYGAYASVNHLHFQTFVRSQPLPLQRRDIASYPLPVQRFDDMQSAWLCLDDLHQQGTPYNLIYDAGGINVVARARQGEVPLQPWSPGFAWSEMAGAFSVNSRDDFSGLTEAMIEQALAALRTT